MIGQRKARSRQAGAALLTALLTVALVASLASTALWQQWRVTEVESAERDRSQAQWLLLGALDWARLILREDGRNGGADHLGEPWALPLQEARLSSFLAAEKSSSALDSGPALDAFLSGEIQDMQSRLNIANLVEGPNVSPADLADFERLFELLDLPAVELSSLAMAWRQASSKDLGAGEAGQLPVLPQRLEQLRWLGVSATTLARLTPYVSLLPVRTALNINTASAEALSASLPGLSLAQARSLVEARSRQHWTSLEQANKSLSNGLRWAAHRHDVASRFFEVRGQIRQDQHVLQEKSLVQRQGLDVKTLWRDRSVLPGPAAVPVRQIEG